MAFTSVYSATKAAVLNLIHTLTPDVAGRGIRVNAISPGFVRTDMFDGISSTEEQREWARGQVSLARLGQPEDAVVYLLSPQASYVAGQELVVDGGLIGCIPLG